MHPQGIEERVRAIDWARVSQDLDAEGYARVERLLTVDECACVAAWYDRAELFRSRVVMAQHGFGRGEYKYFAYPLPELVASLRTSVYPHLAPIANRWNEAMGFDVRFPDHHAEFLSDCHQAGQVKPTPLLLRYGAGDYNCLHQDLYGEQVFPLQVAVLLSAPGKDFTGGDFVMTEQRPRRQSRPIGAADFARGSKRQLDWKLFPILTNRRQFKAFAQHSRLTAGQEPSHALLMGFTEPLGNDDAR